ncbi:MAG TPA: hypothetical protein VGW80_01045 [Solirubrobacterales bacterium]|nr:hypothetical protein [Solirubrobacterales bacterium]
MKTQRQGGGRAVVRGVISEPGRFKSLTVTGHLAYDGSGLSRGTVTMPDPNSNDLVKVDMVQDGAKMYMRSSRFGTLPDGREWLGLDLSLGDDVSSSFPASGDAREELELLEQTAGGVDEIGKEDVRGVATTRYRSEISVSESANRLREEGADTMASAVEERGGPAQVEAWIDAKGLVRRMRIVQSMPGEEGEGPQTTDMRIDFFDFGLEPEIDVPDSNEVFDATSLAKEELDG